MRICTFTRGPGDHHRLGILVNGGEDIVDLTLPPAGVPLPRTYTEWFDLDGPTARAVQALAQELRVQPHRTDALRPTGTVLPRADALLLAPIPRPGKIICIGLNYRDHAAESGMAIPASPVIFAKFPTAVVGPGERVLIPSGCSQPDFEAELAFVVGRRGRNVPASSAMSFVFGYTNFNDVSARDFQFGDGQWTRGKSCDTFAPMGPMIVSADEVPNPHELRIRFRLNGQTLQDSNTRQLIFGIPELIAFLSASMTLEPGDVVATGTPPGVGFARKPPVYLRADDRMEVEIDGLGVLQNQVFAS